MRAKANIITKTIAVVLQGATSIPVEDINQFPDAPNYATLINTITNEYETVIYTGKSGYNLTGCTRGVEGMDREWDASTSVGRFFTAIEWNNLLDTVDNKQTYVVPERAGNIAVLDAEGKLADSGFLPGAITKVASAPLTEEELVTFMETLDDGIYAIETLRNGNEILMKGVVTVVNVETELEEQALRYARYISNGTSYEWNASFEEWNLAAGAGGGGGGSVVNPIRLYPYPFGTDTTLSAAVGNDFKLSIQYQNSQLSTGVLRVYRNTNLVLLQNITTGVTEVDLTQHLRVGSNTFDFTVTDALANSATVTYLVSGVSISVTSSFNDELIYGQDVDIAYSIVGEGSRVALITLDGETVEYPSPTVVNTRSFTGLSHGVHTLSIQAKTTLSSGSVLFSNVLNYNIIAQEVGNSTPIISSKFNTTEAQQGAQLFIDYIVYREGYETLTVNLAVDGVPVGEVIADRSRQRWNISNLEVGERTLTISCAGVTKEFVINIVALDVEFTNVEDSFLKLYLNASSKTNSDVDRTEWNNGYGDSVTTYLNDFNYSTNGWIDGALDFSGRASATIMYKLFQDEVTAIGKTIEFELETNNDLGQGKVFLSCMNGGRGIEIKSDRAILKSSDTTVITLFKENEKIKISFVIDPYNSTTTTYINGVMSGIDRLSTQSAFKQASPQSISVNMSGMGGKLYNVRVYERALTHHEILQNYLFDVTDISEKLYQYNFSNIYDSVGNINIDKVKERIPVMVIRTYGVDQFGNQLPQTSDYRPTVDFTIEHPYDHTKDYTATNVVIRTQGTSTLVYPVKNYRLTLPAGTSYAIDASKTRPTRVLNIKTDYMESSLSTNVGMCRLINAMYESLVPVQEVDPLVITATYGYPIAVFNNNGTDTTFVGLYNLNTDKSDPQTFGHYEGSGFPDSRKFEVLFNAEDHAVAFTRKPGITDAQWFAEVTEGFEGNYPKQDSSSTYTLENYQPLMDMLEFVSNYVNVTPETEEAYKAEFLKRIDFDYAAKYMLTCFIIGAVDSFGKDLMCNTWGVENNEFYKWYFTFYDLDTCIGLDNQGKMVAADGTVIYDYDIELEDAVFAQASSRLWEVLTTFFKTELEAKYASMRATSFTFENIWHFLYDEQISKFSKAMYNSNAKVKYIDAPGAEDWLWMLNGDRINQMKRWITNRLAFLDSKYGYQASEKTVVARISTSDLSQVNFTLTPDIHYWMSMKLGNSASGYDIKRTKAGEPVVLNTEYGASGASFMELTIFNAQHLVDLGDIGLNDAFDLNRLNISAASKIRVLNLGKETTSTVLDEFIIGNNTDLEELNLRNNSALSGPLNLSGCTRLKKLDLRGTSYTSVTLPEGGILEECHLPSTITNVTLKNQQYLNATNFTIEDGAELSLVRVENCPSVDIIYLLGFATADANVRILGTELSVLNNGILDTLYNSLNGRKGITSDGSLTDNYVFYGSAKVLKTTEFNNATYTGYFPNVSFEFISANEGDEYFIASDSRNARGNYDMVAYTGTDEFVVIPDNIVKTKFTLGTGYDLYDFGFANWGVIDAIDTGVFASGIYTVTIPDSIVEIKAGAFTPEYDGYILTELSTVPLEWSVSGVEVFTSQTTPFFEQDGLIIGYNPSGVILARCLTDEDDYTIPSSININEVPTDVYKIGSKFFTTYKNNVTNIYIPAEITIIPNGFTTGFANDCIVWVEVNSRPVGWNSNWNSAGFEVIWSAPSGKRTFNIYDGASVDTTIINYGITESMRIASFLGNWIYSNADLTDSISYPYFGSVGDNNLYLGPIVANATYTYDNEDYKVTGFDTTHFNEGNGTVRINIASSYDDGVHGSYPVTSVASEAIGGTTGNSTRSVIKEIIFAVNVNFHPDGLPAYAFANLDYCESIFLPADVETIPAYCFYNCNLNYINLTNVITIGVHALENNNLTNLTIDQTTVSIGDSALAGNQLVKISMYPYGCELGDNLLTTGDTFKTAYLESSFGIYEGTQTGSWARTGALPTPAQYFTFDSLTGTITDYNSAGGTEVIIPPQIGGVDVLAIGEGAFQNKGLTSIYIVNGITTIENYAIADNNLTSVSIPNSVTYIGANAFKGLSEMDISLGTGFTSYICYVDDGATLVGHISTCEDSSFTIPNGVTKVSENAFDSALFTELTIPESVTIIEDYAFVGSSVVKINMYPLFDEITIGDYIISSVNNDFRTEFISGSKGKYELIGGVWSRTGDMWEYIVRLSDFTYSTNATATLITAVNASVTTINVPAFLNGKPTIINDSYSGVFSDKQNLTSVVFQNGVAFKNNSMHSAFSYCSNLTTAPEIPNSVTTMVSTFYGCNKLTTAPNIPNSVTNMYATFYDCSNLTTAPSVIGNSVTNMAYTFSGCSSLTTAPSVIGNSVTNMVNAFQYCSNLTTAPNIPNSVTDMAGTFSGCSNLATAPNIPNSVTNMAQTFFQCSNLTTAPSVIGNSVTDMLQTFYECKKLTTAPEIPNSVTNMVDTFRDCRNLTTAPSVIPNSVTTMANTFINCFGLTTAPNIPNSVTTLAGTFRSCNNLTTAPNIPNSVTDMYSTFRDCFNLTTAPLVIGNSVTNMVATFSSCINLTTAPEIPNSVTNMVDTFRDCRNLTTAPNIPNSVTTMAQTFFQCSNLTTAPSVIGNSVTNMAYTFYSCYNLTGNIIIKSNKIAVSGGFASTFYSVYSLPQKDVYIPFTGFNATHNTKAAADAYNLDGNDGVTVFELVE